jgi:hypothetical protein
MPGKRVQFDEATWRQLDLLGRDQMKDFQEIADEAFRDLLKKHGRPIDLKDALRKSAGVSATIHRLKPGKKKTPPGLDQRRQDTGGQNANSHDCGSSHRRRCQCRAASRRS